jgi:hypothetical protein
MPQASNIVLADAAATPVNHTFIPMGRDKDEWFWYEDQSAASAIGNWRISVLLQKPAAPLPGQSSEGRNYRVKVQLHEPILANVSNSTVSGVAPAPTLAYTVRSISEFILPERTALLDRQNIAKMFPLLVQNAQIKSVIENLQYLY